MSTLKRIWIPLTAAALALAATAIPAAEMTFSAKMTGASELPEPNASKAEAEQAARAVPAVFLEGGSRPKPFLVGEIPSQVGR